MSRAVGLLRSIVATVTLPPTLAHEATHGVIAAPWADELALVVDPAGVDAALGVDWKDDVPAWALVLSAYGPLVVGALVGVAGIVRLAAGGVPREPTRLVVLGVLAIWWSIYSWPSSDDRDTANMTQNTTEAR
jgi:hypothetical protein